jgi:hypothetical protein
MSRGHAKGPFNLVNPNDVLPVIRVQKQWQLLVGQSQSIQLVADPGTGRNGPVLLRICVNTNTATTNGSNALLIGNTGNPSAYFAAGDSTPGSVGFATEKKFEITAGTTITASFTSNAVKATGVLTITSTTSANTQTVTIGGQTYTFNTVLTNTANNVLIGADITAMAANLASAINAGAGSGTTYGTGTVANASVTATSLAGVVTLTAINAGTGANSVATTETLSNGSFANATLTGGDIASTAGQMNIYMDA